METKSKTRRRPGWRAGAVLADHDRKGHSDRVGRAEASQTTGDEASKRTRVPAREARPDPTCRSGALAGLVASLPVLGPLVGAACLPCAAVGGAALGGSALGIPNGRFLLAGSAILAFTLGRALVKARRAYGSAEFRRVAIRLGLLLASTALATYLAVTLIIAPLLAKALEELARGLSHGPLSG